MTNPHDPHIATATFAHEKWIASTNTRIERELVVTRASAIAPQVYRKDILVPRHLVQAVFDGVETIERCDHDMDGRGERHASRVALIGPA